MLVFFLRLFPLGFRHSRHRSRQLALAPCCLFQRPHLCFSSSAFSSASLHISHRCPLVLPSLTHCHRCGQLDLLLASGSVGHHLLLRILDFWFVGKRVCCREIDKGGDGGGNELYTLLYMQSKMTENSNIKAAGMSASTQPSSPLSGVRKNRSAIWDHFDVENAIKKKAKCKYCGSLIQYGNGTSSMGGHLRRCKQNPNNDSNKRRKTTTTPTIEKRSVLNSPNAFKFDQEEARRAVIIV
ncbi:hypothetical protein Ahy_B05g078499 [Arachis hypogaea]|uniref:BED-type domain-containing protein n=1 Tax=Arachis hypogaea TaxID=3818 RepID=A0A444Z7C4_ARAHY|nr:hypothetical protein Ahy_B05g078499 [Arachis hypogaea]